jgi:hypothetical protein
MTKSDWPPSEWVFKVIWQILMAQTEYSPLEDPDIGKKGGMCRCNGSHIGLTKAATHDKVQMVLRVNFANAGMINNNTQIIGTEGQIDFSGNGLTLSKKKLPKAPGFGNYDSYFTFSDCSVKRIRSRIQFKIHRS